MLDKWYHIVCKLLRSFFSLSIILLRFIQVIFCIRDSLQGVDIPDGSVTTPSPPKNLLLHKSNENTSKNCQNKLIRTLEIKGLKHSKKCLFKKNNWILVRTVSLVMFYHALNPSPCWLKKNAQPQSYELSFIWESY